MPLQATAGAATYDAFGGGVAAAAANYIEDVFQTWLYTGTEASLTITNGVDLSTKGGLVWMKGRSGATDHALYDTARGTTKDLVSNSAAAETTQSTGLTAFGTTGFTIGALAKINTSSATYVSWTFREQAKFFDVVTYTGNGSNRTVAHNLGSVPGCIIVKRTNTTGDWQVYHRANTANPETDHLVLNTTVATGDLNTLWNDTLPTSAVFSLGTDSTVNASGGTYVAYLFAHDAGGFGASGTDNVISCGGYTGNGSTTGPTVTLGYEPQWLMVKNSTGTSNWNIIDNMRGMPVGSADAFLEANDSDAEATADLVTPTATGFQIVSTSSEVNTSSSTYIYIAIRRGPMRTPTTGTSVFVPVTQVLATGSVVTTGFVTDLGISRPLSSSTGGIAESRLTARYLQTSGTGTESAGASTWGYMNGYGPTPWSGSGLSSVAYGFRRAPGFFDVVCYTGTGSATTFSHNLGVVPEMMIVKRRSAADDWWVYDAATGNTKYQVLNSTATPTTSSTAWNNTTPTSSVFSVGTGTPVNASAGTYVAYLFATVAGVSKVGSYTGTGTTLQVTCGFTGGSRFVLIKRTDSTGDWYVWDSARGIVAGNDPYLLLNSTAAEVTGTDYIDTFSSGFEISSTAPAAINANGGTFIFLAIA
jgi:hypothetical protein